MVHECKDSPFQMRLRIPGWADGTKILLNGEDAGVEAIPGTLAAFEREWKDGDVVVMKRRACIAQSDNRNGIPLKPASFLTLPGVTEAPAR